MKTVTVSPAAETLVELSGEYPISAEQRADYQRDGHILLRSVASAEEVAAYRPIINRAVRQFNTETRNLEERDTYGKAFLQTTNLWVNDDEVRRFTLSRRFAKIAAELMGVSGVRIYHDQALYKEPGGGPTPFHQDQYYWPVDTSNTITMWMPLVPVPEEVGSMTFATGAHKLGFVGNMPISDESEEYSRGLIEERGLSLTTYGALGPGDATFHAGWMLHGAQGNPTADMREVMTIIYMAADARAIEPDNEWRARDLQSWLSGIKPGDRVTGHLNPLVYGASQSED